MIITIMNISLVLPKERTYIINYMNLSFVFPLFTCVTQWSNHVILGNRHENRRNSEKSNVHPNISLKRGKLSYCFMSKRKITRGFSYDYAGVSYDYAGNPCQWGVRILCFRGAGLTETLVPPVSLRFPANPLARQRMIRGFTRVNAGETRVNQGKRGDSTVNLGLHRDSLGIQWFIQWYLASEYLGFEG